MHKGIILLLKANDIEDAKTEAQSFIDNCAEVREDGIDWGEVGGRWRGVIRNNAQPYGKARKRVKKWEDSQPERLAELEKSFKEECKRQNIKSLHGLLDGDLFMFSYYLEAIDSLKRKCFSTDVNVFDKDEWTASMDYADKNPSEYWAVMIDVHF